MTGQVRVVLIMVWLAGAVVAAAAAQALQSTLPQMMALGPGWFLLLLLLAIVSELKPVPYALGQVYKDESLTIAIILLTLFTFGWPTAVLIAALSVIVADLASNKPYFKILFNASMYVLASGAAGGVYTLGLKVEPLLSQVLPPLWVLVTRELAAGVAYYTVNLSLLMVVLSRVNRLGLGHMLRWGFRDSALVNLTLIAIAIAMASLWQIHPTASIILVPPIFMAKLGYERYTKLRTEAESMLAALADVTDLRDDATGKHSLRVSEMSYGVARTLGLPEEQALLIKAIGRVHDVGKTVVRDAVLLKPGKLTPQERVEIEAHVEAGGRILSHLSVYQPYLSILMHHHERLDGRGYPLKLKGDEISIGGRILAACDAYDTITSDRPYRSKQPAEIAMAELHNHIGTQFDPKVVEALETWLIGEQMLRADWESVPKVQAGDQAPAPFKDAHPFVSHDGQLREPFARITKS